MRHAILLVGRVDKCYYILQEGMKHAIALVGRDETCYSTGRKC